MVKLIGSEFASETEGCGSCPVHFLHTFEMNIKIQKRSELFRKDSEINLAGLQESSFYVESSICFSRSVRSIFLDNTHTKTFSGSTFTYLRCFQCDQIWRNFATLAKAYQSLANF